MVRLEDGEWRRSDEGAAQGGSISPLLSNIYLHHVFDLWVRRWKKTRAKGDVIVTRFADDFIVGFEHRAEAEQFLSELKQRFLKFGLELHPDKTRLIAFGRYAAERRKERGLGRPETFDFLGFTHICGRTLRGAFTLIRQTMRERFTAKLKEVHAELRRRRDTSIPGMGVYLRSVITGHMHYYGVPMNYPALQSFRYAVGKLRKRALDRRNQRARVSWERMNRLIARWLPPIHSAIRFRSRGSASRPEARAGCVSSARPDLCGGRLARAVPTGTAVRGWAKSGPWPVDARIPLRVCDNWRVQLNTRFQDRPQIARFQDRPQIARPQIAPR